MKPDPHALADELTEEHAALDLMVAGRPAGDWTLATPAQGWTVADTIGHLSYFDETALLSLTNPAAFIESAKTLLASGARGGFDVELSRTLAPEELLTRWREGRAALLDAMRAADPSERVNWYGPPMSLASFISARLMETWAHGMDVADTLDLPPVISARLKHVCHIGVGARPYSYLVKGSQDPGQPVLVSLDAPDGSSWTWGEPGSSDTVTGSALDFALVVTHRRHPDDTDLKVTGPIAAEWISIAQSFAGPSGSGRAPGARRLVQSSS